MVPVASAAIRVVPISVVRSSSEERSCRVIVRGRGSVEGNDLVVAEADAFAEGGGCCGTEVVSRGLAVEDGACGSY